MGAFKDKSLFSHSSEGQKTKTEAPAGLVVSKASLLGLKICPPMVVLLWPYASGVSLYPQISSSYKFTRSSKGHILIYLFALFSFSCF
jgi:hypothetical protein